MMTLDTCNPTINLREIVYPTLQHTQIKPHLFYRSAGFNFMNKEEIKLVESLRLKTILDMRSKSETLANPDPVFQGVRNIQHSGLVSKGGEDIDFSPKGMDKIGNDAYEQINKLTYYYTQMPFQNEAVAKMFEAILQQEVPLLIHCATGKDRTGVAVMCLLMAMGCDRKTILNDYLLTNTYRKSRIDKKLEEDKDRIQDHPELATLILMKEGVDEKIGIAVLDEIEKRYHSYDEFLYHEYNLDKDTLHKLRDLYTE